MADEPQAPHPTSHAPMTESGSPPLRDPIETLVETPEGTFAVSFSPSAAMGQDGSSGTSSGASSGTRRNGDRRPDITPQAGGGGRGGLVRDGGSGTDGAFFGQLQGIPIEYLIATPLIASARANMALAEVMTEFIDELAFQDSKTRIVSFDLTRELQDPVTKKYAPQTITVSAPLLALVPIPALLIQSVTIDLTVQISQSVSANSSSTTSASLNVGADWGWGNASFTGSYTNTQSNTRSTNQSAKYEVTVNAQQQAVPEGMSRLMDVFASTITPIPAGSS